MSYYSDSNTFSYQGITHNNPITNPIKINKPIILPLSYNDTNIVTANNYNTTTTNYEPPYITSCESPTYDTTYEIPATTEYTQPTTYEQYDTTTTYNEYNTYNNNNSNYYTYDTYDTTDNTTTNNYQNIVYEDNNVISDINTVPNYDNNVVYSEYEVSGNANNVINIPQATDDIKFTFGTTVPQSNYTETIVHQEPKIIQKPQITNITNQIPIHQIPAKTIIQKPSPIIKKDIPKENFAQVVLLKEDEEKERRPIVIQNNVIKRSIKKNIKKEEERKNNEVIENKKNDKINEFANDEPRNKIETMQIKVPVDDYAARSQTPDTKFHMVRTKKINQFENSKSAQEDNYNYAFNNDTNIGIKKPKIKIIKLDEVRKENNSTNFNNTSDDIDSKKIGNKKYLYFNVNKVNKKMPQNENNEPLDRVKKNININNDQNDNFNTINNNRIFFENIKQDNEKELKENEYDEKNYPKFEDDNKPAPSFDNIIIYGNNNLGKKLNSNGNKKQNIDKEKEEITKKEVTNKDSQNMITDKNDEIRITQKNNEEMDYFDNNFDVHEKFYNRMKKLIDEE